MTKERIIDFILYNFSVDYIPPNPKNPISTARYVYDSFNDVLLTRFDYKHSKSYCVFDHIKVIGENNTYEVIVYNRAMNGNLKIKGKVGFKLTLLPYNVFV